MRKSQTILASLAAFWTLGGVAAVAQGGDVGSQYTRIDEACVGSESPDEPVYESVCPGYGEWQIHVASGEHGSAAAYVAPDGGRSDYINAPMRGLFGGFHDVVEWRLANGVAFATIHRYIHHNTPEVVDFYGGIEAPNTLIVTALAAEGGAAVCPVAFVDASALAGANQVARDVADRLSRGWDCSSEIVRFDSQMPDVDAYLATRGQKSRH